MTNLLQQWARLTKKDQQVEIKRDLDQLERISMFIPGAVLNWEGTNWIRLGATHFWGLSCTTAGACAICYVPLVVAWPEGYHIEKVVGYCRNSNAITTGAFISLWRHDASEGLTTQIGSDSNTGITTADEYELTIDLTNLRPQFNPGDRDYGFLMLRIENLDQTAGASRFKFFGVEIVFKRT